VIFRGRRYDTGDRLDYIKAIVQLAVDREDLGPGLRPWLHEFVETLDVEQPALEAAAAKAPAVTASVAASASKAAAVKSPELVQKK
jgi:UTP--glucose-1-phosphate uridylyltransferase